MSWKPVLEGAAAARAFAIVERLAADLAPSHFAARASGLAFGPAGLALFLAYVAKATRDPELDARALALVLEALSPRGADAGANGSLFSGFPGLTWLVGHLHELTGAGAEPFLAQADRAIAEALREEPWPGSFNYAEGLIGLGVYALERPASALTDEVLDRIVRHLDARAVSDGPGVAWLRPVASFPVHVRPKSAVFDLGIPRGTTGAIAFLAAVMPRVAGAEPLLRRAIASLLAHRTFGDPNGQFGDWVVPGEPPPPPSRLGWCYGDLGIGLTLLTAARTLDDAELASTALALARATIDRRHVDIEDAGFCHGAAGAGHLYSRLYAATDDARFLAAARRWFAAAVAFYAPAEGSAGFSSYYPTAEDPSFHSETDPTLLMGAAGIGLALLSACRPVAPAWDRYFLINARASRAAR